DKLYSFLADYELLRDPGSEFQYSNLGIGLLGHAIVLKAGKSYESLIVNRICRPLNMTSTGISLAPEMKSRLASGHDKSGRLEGNWEFQALAGCGALRSTANDLLKYVAANLGLTQSDLTPLMEKTQVFSHQGTHGLDSAPGFFGHTAMPWVDEN